jgi:DNA helicase-2/ATP-dependent DNA helicase PcrA
MKSLEKILENLNPQQLEAVQKTEGPVMVLAGPGTGKTQILASRIAYILKNRDVDANQILCLTYTDAGTVAMRNRLLQFIGPEAHQVHIHTFHSFCSMVIRENESVLGYRALEPVTELERFEIIRQLIDDLPLESKLKRLKGDPYYEVDRLNKFFLQIKHEGWSTPEMIHKIEHQIDHLEDDPDLYYKRNYKEFKKGDPNPTKFNQAQYDLELLRDAVSLYDVFQERLLEARRFDYDDMLQWTMDLFQNEPHVLLQYQEQFAYFLVDEYQDTSQLQNDILEKLIGYWDQPNVFVVGDDDQSIYSFQGANVKNIINFHSLFSDSIHMVVLERNYRSSPPVLEIATDLIRNNEERLTSKLDNLSKALTPYGDFRSYEFQSTINHFETDHLEAQFLCNQIKRLLDEGVQASEIAILYRNHSSADLLTRLLKSENLPFQIKKEVNVLEQPETLQIIKVLEYILMEGQNPLTGSHLLFEILHFLCDQVSAFTFARLAVHFRKENASWREGIAQIDSIDWVPKEEKSKLKQVWSDLEFWIKRSFEVTHPELVEQVIVKGGFFQRAMLNGTESTDCIRSFFEFVKNENRRNPFGTLEQLLATIQLHQQNRINLPLVVVSGSSEGVQLSTVHGSKGLEYEYVFLMHCAASKWDKGYTRSTFKAITRIFEIDSSKDYNVEEARRLFFVAITRGKKEVHFTFHSQSSGKQKPNKPSRFLSEVAQSDHVVEQTPDWEQEDLDSLADLFIRHQPESPKSFIHEHLVDQQLENYVLSVTHLNNYMRCPTAFYFNNLLRVPAAKSESAGFGNAIHKTFERAYNLLGSNQPLDLPVLLNLFEDSLKQQSDSFTKDRFVQTRERGKILLEAYWDQYQSDFNTEHPFETEVIIQNVEVDGVPIKGVIDRVDDMGDSLHVVDYKTGSSQYGKKKLKRPDGVQDPVDSEDDQSDYWRQIVFYHLLLQKKRPNKPVLNGTVDFVEPDKLGQFERGIVRVEPDDVEYVKRQIQNTYQLIMDKVFSPGCQKDDCEWCNFVRYYYS